MRTVLTSKILGTLFDENSSFGWGLLLGDADNTDNTGLTVVILSKEAITHCQGDSFEMKA